MRKALIIEDNIHTLEILKGVLTESFPDIEILAESTIAKARAQLSDGINLAIVDVNLPDGNGLCLVEDIHRDHPHVYTVVATIYDDDEHIFPALAVGAKGYVLKEEPLERLTMLFSGIAMGIPPISPSVLRRILRKFEKPVDEKPAADLKSLTVREKEVHSYLVKGCSSKEIARLMSISSHTVNDHIKNIYRKLNVSTRVELAAFS